MVRVSTIVILAGIGLLLIPIPPVATILGILVILLGIVLRLVTDL
ncbi:transporter [Natronorubrum aibiense]|uniref:Transporter n=1 Tax=Natronorubrum aibiense TaxID=348826 RepID=A0A5P9P5P1_9EURY|nr:transporter [Natronorubrum aibiense]QFU83287.1 transporter [Natronorubrum aibiense]